MVGVDASGVAVRVGVGVDVDVAVGVGSAVCAPTGEARLTSSKLPTMDRAKRTRIVVMVCPPICGCTS